MAIDHDARIRAPLESIDPKATVVDEPIEGTTPRSLIGIGLDRPWNPPREPSGEKLRTDAWKPGGDPRNRSLGHRGRSGAGVNPPTFLPRCRPSPAGARGDVAYWREWT